MTPTQRGEPDQSSNQRLPPRRIACLRCRRRKKRCDHAVPVCGECRKTNSECIQVGIKSTGSMTTVPTAYLRQLESQLSAVQERQEVDLSSNTIHSSADPETRQEESGYPSPLENSCSYENLASANSGDSITVHHVEERGGDAGLPDETGLTRHGSSPVIATFPDADLRASMSSISSPQPPATRTSLLHMGNSQQQVTSLRASSQLSDELRSIGDDWMDHYSQIYFRQVHPQWSFIDEDSWRRDYNAWASGARWIDDTQIFIVQLVLAIGALLGSSYRQDCPHLIHASKLYGSAVQRLGSVTQQPSSLLRTQASLLMTIYAWHDSCPDAVQVYLTLMLMNCASLIDQDKAEDATRSSSSEYQLLRRQCIMSCHIVSEVAASAWSYPLSVSFEALDYKIFQYASTMKRELSGPDFYERLFQLRHIQSRIRHTNKKLQRLDPSDLFRDRCRVQLKDELEAWKASTQAFASSTPPDHVVFHEPESLLKLYDYSLSILMQERPSIMSVQDIGQLVECCSEACRTFWTSQQSCPLMYWTWTALMYQFRIGIMLLYCYFTTPQMIRTPVFSYESTMAGIDSCRQTLTRFSLRWPKSELYLRTFQLLEEKTFTSSFVETGAGQSTLESSTTSNRCPTTKSIEEWTSAMEALVTELKLQHLHQAVTALIQEMIHSVPNDNFSVEAIEFGPYLTLGSTDLFGFDVPR